MLIQRSVSVTALAKRAPLNARSQKNKLAPPRLSARATSPSTRSPEPGVLLPILAYGITFDHICSLLSDFFPLKIHTCRMCVRLYGVLFRACHLVVPFPDRKHDKSRHETYLKALPEQTEIMSYPKKIRYPGTVIAIKWHF